MRRIMIRPVFILCAIEVIFAIVSCFLIVSTSNNAAEKNEIFVQLAQRGIDIEALGYTNDQFMQYVVMSTFFIAFYALLRFIIVVLASQRNNLKLYLFALGLSVLSVVVALLTSILPVIVFEIVILMMITSAYNKAKIMLKQASQSNKTVIDLEF